MGIQVEYNPDLALRHMDHYTRGERALEECLPEDLTVGEEYNFLKKGQRLYWLLGEMPLLQTEGDGKLSRPLASIVISEATHFKLEDEVWTKGKYQVKELYDTEDPAIHFEGFTKR